MERDIFPASFNFSATELGMRYEHARPLLEGKYPFVTSFVGSSHRHSPPSPLGTQLSGTVSTRLIPFMDSLGILAPKIDFARENPACIQSRSPTCGYRLGADYVVHTFPEGMELFLPGSHLFRQSFQ